MALSVIQTGTAISSTGTLIISFSAVTVNNLVVFGVMSSTTAGTVISVNDTAGNTYTKARGTAAQAVSVEQWYGLQATGGATKGTILFGGVPSTFGQMFEISGINATPLDQTSTGTSNTGTVLSVASLTPSVGSSIIIANYRQGGAQAWTVGAGYTMAGTTTQAVSEYQILTSNAAQTASITGTQLAAWAGVAANYQDAGGGVAASVVIGYRTLLGIGN